MSDGSRPSGRAILCQITGLVGGKAGVAGSDGHEPKFWFVSVENTWADCPSLLVMVAPIGTVDSLVVMIDPSTCGLIGAVDSLVVVVDPLTCGPIVAANCGTMALTCVPIGTVDSLVVVVDPLTCDPIVAASCGTMVSRSETLVSSALVAGAVLVRTGFSSAIAIVVMG